ncbi:unnamed protein product [Rotaria sp. Silwood1]|nr:unnamed protein product [Rotaria sp. Silwood1]CAF4868351.1 unnamed protein product [Rotaria sp. Silwood1]
MLPTTINSTEPTTINSTEPTNDTTSTTTTIDNQINNNLIETLPWLPNLPSKFKDKQRFTKRKIQMNC